MREKKDDVCDNNIFRNTLLETQYYILYDIVKYDSLNYDKWYYDRWGHIEKEVCW